MSGSSGEGELAILLRTQYGIEALGIEPGERGSVAETFVVSTAVERRFMKLIPVSRFSENLELSLPAQQALHEAGFAEIPAPMPTLGGQLSVDLGDQVLVVYDFVDGVSTSDYDFASYVDLLARVHATAIASPPGRATFDDPLLPAYRRLLSDNDLWQPHFAAQRELQDGLHADRDELERDLDRYSTLIAELDGRSGQDVPTVLTHGDAPGNILRDGSGGLHLIDWDDLLLAPPERDTWCHLLDERAAGEFLSVYRRTFPDYVPDSRLRAFYLYRRYFEDIEGIVTWAREPDATEERAHRVLGYYDQTMVWLRPAIRAARAG